MLYHNTRHTGHNVALSDAVLSCTAPDQGIYMPDSIREIPKAVINNLPGMNSVEIGYIVTGTAFDKDIPLQQINQIVKESITFPLPLKKLDDQKYILEMFHGPTGTCKDLGARFMSRILHLFAHPDEGKLNVLVASTVDSGLAVAAGFSQLDDVNVFILFPHGQLSDNQLNKFAAYDNVYPIAIRGSFDDCRRLVRQLLADTELNENYRLTSANSINIARLLPQTIYFFDAYARLIELTGECHKNIVCAIPGGNLGCLTAGIIAKRMGLPISRFISTHNANDTFVRYLATGKYQPHDTIRTIAPALDVSAPENFERILDLYNNSHADIANEIEGISFSDTEINDIISRSKSQYDYFLSSPSSTAVGALEKCLQPNEIGIAFATTPPPVLHIAKEKSPNNKKHHDAVRTTRSAESLKQLIIQLNSN